MDFISICDVLSKVGLCAKDYINEDFAVITADDFYGDIAFKDLSDGLDNDKYIVIGYELADTLSPNGSVKRGVVLSHDGIIDEVLESVCTLDGDKVLVEPLNKSKEPRLLPKNNSVSMLMYGLKPDIFGIIDSKMVSSFESNKDDLDTYEFYIPDILSEEIASGRTILDVPTKSRWFGLTYKEDIDILSD